MTETNDYEKAKQECQNECYDKFLKTAGWTKEQVPEEVNLTFNFLFEIIFNRAYQLGKAYTQPVNGLANERLQVAAMAMQGLLSNSTWMSILARGYCQEYDNDKDASAALVRETVSSSLEITDALLTELNKPTNEKENQ